MPPVWINIPMFPEPGQPHAFADRSAELRSLYMALVSAGNAVRAGDRHVHHKHVVYGYEGVGKSALILQVLKQIRGDVLPGDSGQRIDWPDNIPHPDDPHKWIVLRLSGKNHANIAALRDGIAGQIRQEQQEESLPTLDMVRTLHGQAHHRVPTALGQSFLHRLLRREKDLYDQVRSSLTELAETLDSFARWQGGVRRDVLRQYHDKGTERQASGRAGIKAGLTASVAGPLSAEGEAGLETAVDIIHKHGAGSHDHTEYERTWRIDAQMLTDALNKFFRSTREARLPTLLILDDFDEFASSQGPSVRQRAQVLDWLLGPFSQLQPTCLVVGLRAEYVHGDTRRQYVRTHVPALSRTNLVQVIEAWSEVQTPVMESASIGYLTGLGAQLMSDFDKLGEQHFDPAQTPVAMPFRVLQAVRRLSTQGADVTEPARELWRRYIRDSFSSHAVRALDGVARRMPKGDILDCAAGRPLARKPYDDVPQRDLDALAEDELLRPAMASDPNNHNIIIDPLAAYLRVARE